MVRLRVYFYSLIAGLAFSAAFHPIGLWWSAHLAIAILIKVLHRSKNVFLPIFIFGFTSSLVVLAWSKTFVGVVPWLLLALLQGLYYLPVAFVEVKFRNIPATLASLLVMDSVKSIFPFGGFGWMRFGFTQVDSPLAVFYPYLGVVGVTAIAFFSILIFFLRLRTAGILLLLLTTFTTITFSIEREDETLRIRAVQGGVPERGLNFNLRAQAVLDLHIAQTIKEFDSSDELILWPENAVDIDPSFNSTVQRKLESLQKLTGLPLLAGVITGEDESYNSAILFSENAVAESIYQKRYLTPFGEYIPLRNLASVISHHVDKVDDFLAGDKLEIHTVNGVSIASIICYELLNDSIIRESALRSDILAVMTNSATFSGSSEGLQQLEITRVRAMESGRYAISVSTTGPSAIVDPQGRVIQRLGDGEVGSISGVIPVLDTQTIQSRYGELISRLILFLATSVIGLRAIRSMKGRKN